MWSEEKPVFHFYYLSLIHLQFSPHWLKLCSRWYVGVQLDSPPINSPTFLKVCADPITSLKSKQSKTNHNINKQKIFSMSPWAHRLKPQLVSWSYYYSLSFHYCCFMLQAYETLNSSKVPRLLFHFQALPYLSLVILAHLLIFQVSTSHFTLPKAPTPQDWVAYSICTS